MQPDRSDADLPLFDFSLNRFGLKLVYMLLSLPLGCAYFVFIVAGMSVGIGTAIIWIGIPIIALVLIACRGLGDFERWLSSVLLGVDIPGPARETEPDDTLWRKLKRVLASGSTWRRMLFLALKFPFGVLAFTTTVTLIAVSVGLMATPLLYPYLDIRVLNFDFATWRIATFEDSLLAALLGVLLAGASFLVIDGIAGAWGQFSAYMLRTEEWQPRSKEPQQVVTID